MPLRFFLSRASCKALHWVSFFCTKCSWQWGVEWPSWVSTETGSESHHRNMDLWLWSVSFQIFYFNQINILQEKNVSSITLLSHLNQTIRDKNGFFDVKLKDAEWRMEGEGLRVKNWGCRIKSEEWMAEKKSIEGLCVFGFCPFDMGGCYGVGINSMPLYFYELIFWNI